MSIGRILGSWAAICILMIANGAAREILLVKELGRDVADSVSAALGVGIILFTTRLFFRPLAGKPNTVLAAVSAAFVGLTIAFEFTFGHYVEHRSWSELFANYELWNGRLWPLVLLVLGLTPWIWGRWSPAEPRATMGVSHAR